MRGSGESVVRVRGSEAAGLAPVGTRPHKKKRAEPISRTRPLCDRQMSAAGSVGEESFARFPAQATGAHDLPEQGVGAVLGIARVAVQGVHDRQRDVVADQVRERERPDRMVHRAPARRFGPAWERVIPDYRDRRDWLAEHGGEYDL